MSGLTRELKVKPASGALHSGTTAQTFLLLQSRLPGSLVVVTSPLVWCTVPCRQNCADDVTLRLASLLRGAGIRAVQGCSVYVKPWVPELQLDVDRATKKKCARVLRACACAEQAHAYAQAHTSTDCPRPMNPTHHGRSDGAWHAHATMPRAHTTLVGYALQQLPPPPPPPRVLTWPWWCCTVSQTRQQRLADLYISFVMLWRLATALGGQSLDRSSRVQASALVPRRHIPPPSDCQLEQLLACCSCSHGRAAAACVALILLLREWQALKAQRRTFARARDHHDR